MKPSRKRREGLGALELVEQAVHLLRTAPAGTLAIYYLGALPFVLGWLYFWADMSRSPFAQDHAVGAALGLAVLFLWLKFWQAEFAQRLRAQLFGIEPARLTGARARRILYTQSALQPTALFLIPLSVLPVFPFPWVYTFYQNLTVQAVADVPTLRALFARSWRHTLLWPVQKHCVFLVLLLFGFFVLLNCGIAGLALPELLKTLFGVETIFSRSHLAMLNTTFFSAMVCVTFLCVDPIVKAVFVLRVFHGDSLQTGDDLRAVLKPFALKPARVATLVLLGLALLAAAPLGAQENPPPPGTAIPPQELDRAISEVIQQRKYTWRMPREQVVEPKAAATDGPVSRFIRRIGKFFADGVRGFFNWLEKMVRKIFGPSRGPTNITGTNWVLTKQMLLYGLLALVASAAILLGLYFWRHRRRREPELVVTQALQPLPDLTDENVAADQLPEDGWTRLARELMARGEFRLALRAFYLASLASLAERNLVSLAQFKSNRDYLRELQRRGHAFPALQSLFDENVRAFDRVWYGRHEASGELVTQFAANVERIKTGS